MKPLIVLVSVFLIALLATGILSGTFGFALSARVAMSAMLGFTAIGHFMFTKGMEMMMPSFLPFKKAAVIGSGFLEILAAITLLIPVTSIYTAWFLVGFFILLLPININAALKRVDYEKASYQGKGPGYLWFRVPLQLLYIGWAWFCASY